MNEFYHSCADPPAAWTTTHLQVVRQGVAGLLWSKQFYHYSVRDWLNGDPSRAQAARRAPPGPQPPLDAPLQPRRHLDARHMGIPLVCGLGPRLPHDSLRAIDPQFTKEQLLLLLREWYMHPNGQIPAYEFSFDDVNPPVHAWACWRVYKMTAGRGQRDLNFLAQAFHKLLINFTWWVNRKDPKGNNVFGGGFLGMDNIGAFDRNQVFPGGGHLEQADGTAWMAFYCGTMLSMALELAGYDAAYEGVASKFFEHYITIADAMNTLGGTGLWDPDDGFYHDQISYQGHVPCRMPIRSMVGLIPLSPSKCSTRKSSSGSREFGKRLRWFLDHRPDLRQHISCMDERRRPHRQNAPRHPLPRPPRARPQIRLRRKRIPLPLRPAQPFQNPRKTPARIVTSKAMNPTVDYDPGESTTGMFGGNSNWRGPVWFPVNYLLMEALQRYDYFYGDTFTVECPTGSGKRITLGEAADELGRRLVRLFLPDAKGRRPCHGDDSRYATDPNFKDLDSILRIFPRRHRPRLRRQPPNRLDRPRRQNHPGLGPSGEVVNNECLGSWFLVSWFLVLGS